MTIGNSEGVSCFVALLGEWFGRFALYYVSNINASNCVYGSILLYIHVHVNVHMLIYLSVNQLYSLEMRGI